MATVPSRVKASIRSNQALPPPEPGSKCPDIARRTPPFILHRPSLGAPGTPRPLPSPGTRNGGQPEFVIYSVRSRG